MGTCPNLRKTKTGGLFSTPNYHCSVTGKSIDKEYVNRICNAPNVKDRNGNWHGTHTDCNAFKKYGIGNSVK